MECRTATVFFHLLGRKAANGRIGKEEGRFACVAVLSVLDADDLQKLLLSRRIEKRFDKAMPARLKVLQRINVSTEANRFCEQLKQVCEAGKHCHNEDNDDNFKAHCLLEARR